jgi:hypothetical protein
LLWGASVSDFSQGLGRLQLQQLGWGLLRVNVRKMSGPLSHIQVRNLIEANHVAAKIGKPLTVFLTIHPAHLMDYPSDIGRWLQSELNVIRIWCQRAGFGYFAIWVRENFDCRRTEHFHMLLHVPEAAINKLAVMMRSRFAGEGVVDIQPVVSPVLPYLMKQMTPQAWFALGGQVRRQTASDRTGAPVAPVMGKRCGVSRTLTLKPLWSTGRLPTNPSRSDPERH